MSTLEEQIQWCRQAAAIVGVTKKLTALDIPNLSTTIGALIKDIEGDKRKKYPKARVCAEVERYRQRLEMLGEEAKRIKDQVDTVGKKKSASQMQTVGENLTRLHNTIRLGLAEIDPTTAGTKDVKELRKKAEQHRPVYEDKRRRIQEAIDELTQFDPRMKEVLELKALKEAGILLEPDYAAAYKKLAGLTRLLKEGRKASAKMERVLGKTEDGQVCRDALKAAKEAITAFDDRWGLGHAQETQRLNGLLKDCYKGLDEKDASTFGPARLAAKKVETDATERREALEALQLLVDKALETCGSALRLYEGVAPIDKVAPMLQRFSTAQASAGNQQLEKLDETIKTLESEIRLDLERQSKARLAWRRLLEGDVKEGLAKAQSVLEHATPGANPNARQLAARLNEAITYQAMPLANQRRYDEAAAIVEPLAGSLDFLRQWTWTPDKNKTYPDVKLDQLGDGETRFHVEMRQLMDQRIDHAAALSRELERLAGCGLPRTGLPTDLQGRIDRLEEATRAFNVILRDADQVAPKPESQTAEERQRVLDDRLKTAKLAFDQQIADPQKLVLAELQKSTPDPEAVKRYQLAQRLAKEQRGWEAVRSTVLNQLKEISAMLPAGSSSPESVRVGTLTEELENLLKDGIGKTPEEYDKLDAQAKNDLIARINTTLQKTLMPKVGQLREDALAVLKPLRDGKPQLVTDAEKLLKKLEAELKPAKPKKGEAKAPWQDYAQTLRTELAAAILMVDTDDHAVLEQGLADLAKLKTDVEEMLKTPTGGQESAVKKGFGEVEAARKTLHTAVLDTPDPAMKSYFPNELGQLAGEVRSLLPGVLKGLSPAEAKEEIAKLQTKADQLKQRAIDEQAAHQKLMEPGGIGQTVKDALAQLLLDRPEAQALHRNLTKRFDATAPGLMTKTQAELELRDLLGTINAAKLNPQACEALELKAGQDELRQTSESETVKEHYEAERSVFSKNEMRRAAQVSKATASGERNASLYQQIAVHYKQSRKDANAAEKMTDPAARQEAYATAQRSLTLAREAAEAFIANPLRATAASRKALLKAHERWKIAVGDYVGSVLALKKHLDDALKTEPTAPSAWAATAIPSIGQLVPLVDGQAFDADSETLAKPATGKPDDLVARRRTKEAMLQRLAQFERQLVAHPVLAYARTHPTTPVRLDTLSAALGGLRSAALAS